MAPARRGKKAQRVEPGFIATPPAPNPAPQRRGPGRPRKQTLAELLDKGQEVFVANLDLQAAQFIDRHRVNPLVVDCDAWWFPREEKLLFIGVHPASEKRFLYNCGCEGAPLEMRVSGLTLYRVEGRGPIVNGNGG